MKKKVIGIIVVTMITTAVLSGCKDQGNILPDDESISEQSTEEASSVASVQDTASGKLSKEDSVVSYEDITNYDSTEMMEGDSLTEEKISEMEDYLSKAENAAFVTTSYRTPDEIKGDNLATSGEVVDINCDLGIRNEKMIQLVVSFPGTERYNRRITLLETEDSNEPYMFYSNRQLWEENVDKIIEASNYGTDEKTTCGVITDYGEWGPEIDVIEDNSVVSFIVLSPQIGDRLKCTNVKEIEFCDINGDSYNDMIAILEYGDEIVAVLCGGGLDKDGSYVYDQWKDGYSDWLSDNVSDITAANVIDYILEHQDEFKNV